MPSNGQFMSFPDRSDRTSQLGRDQAWVHARILTHGAVRLLDKWVPELMSDPQWRLYCNLDEGAVVNTEHGDLALQANCLYVLPAWLSWRGRVEKPLRHMYFGVDIPAFSRNQSRSSWNKAYQLVGPEAESIIHDWQAICFRWLEGELQQGSELCYWYQIMYRILQRFLAEHPVRGDRMPKELQSVSDYIEKNLGADLSNEHLAEIALCSSGHLIRQFGKLLQQTPASFVRERRLTAAAHRLAFTEDSVDLIADELGFPNRHYMTRVFTKAMGYAPAAYRKMVRA